MKFIAAIILAMPLLSFGQNTSQREELEESLLSSLKSARQAILDNLQYMPDRDLRRTENLLKKARLSALGIDPDDQIPPPRPSKVCVNEEVDLYQKSFQKIKNFAYSTAGLNLSSSGAVDYATSWSKQNPCSYVDKFIVDFSRIKKFAYASHGLNMSNTDAVQYASNMITRLCVSVAFEEIFTKHFQFAYTTQGLNMSHSDAVLYARPKMELEGFACIAR